MINSQHQELFEIDKFVSQTVVNPQKFLIDDIGFQCVVSVSRSMHSMKFLYSAVVEKVDAESKRDLYGILQDINDGSDSGFYRLKKYNEQFVCTYTQSVITDSQKKLTAMDLQSLLCSGVTHLKSAVFDLKVACSASNEEGVSSNV